MQSCTGDVSGVVSSSLMRGICTLVTSDNFVVGAQVLAHSLRRVGTTAPTFALVTPNISAASRAALASSGYRLIVVQPLAHGNANTHVPSWAEVGYTKLRVWQLTMFDRLLYIDADCVVHANVDHLLGEGMARVTFGAAADTFPPDRFNAGVMLLRPSRHIFAALLRRMSCTPSYDGGDTGFLNEFFRGWFAAPSSCVGGGPGQQCLQDLPPLDSPDTPPSCARYRRGMCRLSFGYNALRTMQWFTKKAPKYWQAVQPMHIVHYCSSPKPWEDLEQRRGGFLEQQFFDAFDEMRAEEAAATTPPAYSQLSALPLEFVADEAGDLHISTSCAATADPTAAGSTFHALQTLLAANMHHMPLGELRFTGSGHAEEEEEEGASAALQTSTATITPSSKPTPADAKPAAAATSSVDSATSSTVATAPSGSPDPLSPLGSVRPLRRGVWLSPDREHRFLDVSRAVLQACVLGAVERSTTCRPCSGIPRRIHQIWLGGPLPKEYAEWSASWQRLHPPEAGWTYTLWTDEDLPKFPLCESLTDASSAFLAGHLRSLLARCTSHAQRSDLLRLDILWTLGGLYVDTDFEALADFAPFHAGGAWQHTEFYAGFSNVGVVECNNGLIASVPQQALIGRLIQSIDLPEPEPSSRDTQTHSNMQIIETTGPGHFTRTCVKYIEEWTAKHATQESVWTTQLTHAQDRSEAISHRRNTHLASL